MSIHVNEYVTLILILICIILRKIDMMLCHLANLKKSEKMTMTELYATTINEVNTQ